MIHLGMSGSLRILYPQNIDTSNQQLSKPQKHDHFDIILKNSTVIRYRDPRRFGALLYFHGQKAEHKLFASLGPEPLSTDFNLTDFYNHSRKRKVTIKQFIMDAHEVVGV